MNMVSIDNTIKDLYGYKPELTKKADFDSFWQKAVAELRCSPLEYSLEPLEYPVKQVKVSKITIKGYDNASINCIYVTPANFSGKLPVMVHYHGYGFYKGFVYEAMPWLVQNFAVMFAGVRAQDGDCPDTTRYSNGCHTGWMALGIENPGEYYFKGVYLDCIRVLDFIMSREETDKERVCTYGESQGGALCLVAAALDKRVALSMPTYPAFADFENSLGLTSNYIPFHPYSELLYYYRLNDPKCVGLSNALNTLSYFDVKNFAQEIKCHVCFGQGLNDNVITPESVFAVYNHINSEKEIHIYPCFGHELIPSHEEVRIGFVCRYFT